MLLRGMLWSHHALMCVLQSSRYLLLACGRSRSIVEEGSRRVAELVKHQIIRETLVAIMLADNSWCESRGGVRNRVAGGLGGRGLVPLLEGCVASIAIPRGYAYELTRALASSRVLWVLIRVWWTWVKGSEGQSEKSLVSGVCCGCLTRAMAKWYAPCTTLRRSAMAFCSP